MRSLVLDTSVAIAWYLPETFRAAARVWQSRLLDGRVRLVVPGLHYWEFGNVLRTYVMRSEPEDLPLLTAERTTTPWVVKLGRRVESVFKN